MNDDIWVWIDLEMTGLNTEFDQIMEVACVLTHPDLEVINPESFRSVVHHSDAVLEEMSEWCKVHHQVSGLTDEVKNSQEDIASVEQRLIRYLDHSIVGDPTLYLCGNSIATDRNFIRKYMPILESRLHYRMIDVTSINLVVNASFSDVPKLTKESTHRAKQDILDSIDELRHYIRFLKK